MIHFINYIKLFLKRIIFDELDLTTDLSVCQGDGTWLSNSANYNLYKILKQTKEFNGSHFVDLGCGKGGTLYLVALFFTGNKATGIEIDKKAVEICKKNLSDYEVDIICDDVKEIIISSTMDFFYMSNPFGSETMSCVLDNIICSIKKYPRDIHILYRNPVENDTVIDKGFRLINQFFLKKLIGIRHWYHESSPGERVNLYKLEKIS